MGGAYTLVLAVQFLVASVNGAPLPSFRLAEPDFGAKNELVITNSFGKWPSSKESDRLFIELENRDETGGEVLFVAAKGIAVRGKDKGRDAWTRATAFDLPDVGSRSIVLPRNAVIGNLDPAKISCIRLSLEKGVKMRFGVRRMLFLAPKEEVPKVENEAPRRNRREEREHAASLKTFREACGGDGFAVGQVSSMVAIRPRAGFAVRRADQIAGCWLPRCLCRREFQVLAGRVRRDEESTAVCGSSVGETSRAWLVAGCDSRLHEPG